MAKKQTATTLETSSASTALALPTITRGKANQLLVARATKLYHEARSAQQDCARDFEQQYGRCDKLDPALLADLQHLQLRFAAISARQRRAAYGEPKVSKYVEQIGVMIGTISAHLATDRAMELFGEIDKRDYLGWDRGEVGEKGLDESVLAGYVIIDDAELAEAESDEDGPCVEHVPEPIEGMPGRGICTRCDQEVPLDADSAQVAA